MRTSKIGLFAALPLGLLLAPAAARAASAETCCVVIQSGDMDGNWPVGRWGGGGRAPNGTALSKTVTLPPGSYQVYIRAINSFDERATYRIQVGGDVLLTPPQGKDLRLGWLRSGRVTVPGGPTLVSVEEGEQDGREEFYAIALSRDVLCDAPGRAVALNQYVLREVARASSRLAVPRSSAEARRLQQAMRARLLRSLGLDPPPPRTPLNPVTTGTIDRGDYVIEKIAFESRPHYVVPALLYLPKKARFPVPAVIGTIGHWRAGKSSMYPQQRAVGLAKLGYVALNFDPSYAWERRIPGNSEGSDPYLSGASINGHMAWDTMRAVDYLLTRKEVDPDRIALSGASGGGQQALYAGAVDKRIKVVAPAVYIWSFNDITAHWDYSSDNWPPGVLENGDMGATLALIAPRSLLVLSTTEDYVPVDGSARQVEQARAYYHALGVEDRIVHSIHAGKHGYGQPMREAFYGWLDKWLRNKGDGSPVAEPALDTFPEKAPELLVFPGGHIPAEGASTVRSIWTEEARRLVDGLPAVNPKLPAQLRSEVLRLGPRSNPKVRNVEGSLLITSEAGIEMPAVLIGRGPRAIIFLTDNGIEHDVASETVREMARDSSVLVIEPRGLSTAPERRLANQAAILLGRPLPGMWVRDVLAAFDYLKAARRFRSVSIAASGRYAGLAALLATVLEPGLESAQIEGLFPSFLNVLGQDAIAEIPGMLRLADVPQLVRAAGSGRVVLLPTSPTTGSATGNR